MATLKPYALDLRHSPHPRTEHGAQPSASSSGARPKGPRGRSREKPPERQRGEACAGSSGAGLKARVKTDIRTPRGCVHQTLRPSGMTLEQFFKEKVVLRSEAITENSEKVNSSVSTILERIEATDSCFAFTILNAGNGLGIDMLGGKPRCRVYFM